MRRVHLATWIVLSIGCGAGCTSDATDAEDNAASALGADWTSIGTGIAYRNTGDGPGVWIGYAGYSVRDAWSCAWTEALHRARLARLGIGNLYCVRGPTDAAYGTRDIASRKLATHVLATASEAPFIFVGAHSSGSYVAHELLAWLEASSPELLAKVVYANLDGGGGMSESTARALRKVAFVWAEDRTLAAGRSANAGTMIGLGAAFGGAALRITVDGSGCNSGARWCLHDTLVTTRPHDPQRYDLHADYTNFEDRSVQTAWVDALAPSLR